ncbi:MAG: deoxyribodipyrimidine photo-lyase [Candidatus Thorarchaeota archaeon]|nr:deoxyribodipyrimidine photo-lyase [Candidatus Thorarchaeota archaeon]
MIHEERIQQLNPNSIQGGDYVLYWMQASQRTDNNHALEYAIQMANRYELPLVVYFGLTDEYPEANERSYLFLLEGLVDVEVSLIERNIPFVVRQENPQSGAIELAKDCSLLIVDRGYQRLQRFWRSHVAASVQCPVIQVESNVIVPVEVASPKEEYSAGTFRPKIHQELDRYLQPLVQSTLAAYDTEVTSLNIEDPKKVVNSLSIDGSVKGVDWLKGGTRNAREHLSKFISKKLDHFDTFRNDPSDDYLSWMSPYLHFGQISPLEIALRVTETASEGAEPYLEELIVRRELSMNFVYYNSQYDSIECLPDWAKTTLCRHTSDKREYLYSQEEFEFGETHDTYWNAAQIEMTKTGKMHGYMRMYWGKKILEWSESPSEAYRIALYLNNKYELDGRDPNGYTGVAWCFGKHDRAWRERPVFGKVRYMNARGLERKFDIEAYVRRVS